MTKPVDRPHKEQPDKGVIGSRAGDSKYRRQATDRMEQAKVQVIGLLRQGKTLIECADAVGRSDKTIYRWMYDSPKFARSAKAAQEAWLSQVNREQRPWREQQDEFEPVLRKDYPNWVEYQIDFRKRYFNHDTFEHQEKMLEALDNAPAGGISMILIPPEWTKSTLILDTIIGDICANPNMRFALVSEGQDLARKMLFREQQRMTFQGGVVPPLIEHFGPFKAEGNTGKKWNADELTVMASTHDEQDATILSIGVTGAIRGYRWDRVYLDDIQSLRNLSQTEPLVAKIRGDIASRPGRMGKLIVAGSRVGRNDVYNELIRLDIIDELFVMQALDITKPIGQQSNFPRQFDPDGIPIVNEAGDQMGWNDEDLAQKRRIVGEDQWSRAYMQQPQSDFSAMLTDQDIVNATELDRRVGQPALNSVANVASLDPSLHAHAAFTYCGYDADHLYVLDVVDLFRPTTNQNIFAEMLRGTLRFKPDWWVIENNTLQSGYLTDDAFLELKEKHGFRSQGHHTGENKRDEKLGIPTMMQAIVRKEILFPMIDEEHIGFARLFDQLKAWREDIPTKQLVQDEVMSLWFAYLKWRQLRGLVGQDLTAWKRDGLSEVTLYPHARTNLQGIDLQPASRAPLSYEQVWDQLTGKATVDAP
jgi:hypothetical protein